MLSVEVGMVSRVANDGRQVALYILKITLSRDLDPIISGPGPAGEHFVVRTHTSLSLFDAFLPAIRHSYLLSNRYRDSDGLKRTPFPTFESPHLF